KNHKPQPLLRSSGLKWIYQLSMELRHKLQESITEHYQHFRHGQIDKSTMPVYLFLSGIGPGKSRNASELHNSAIESVEDEELKKKLQDAWVFHTSLENG